MVCESDDDIKRSVLLTEHLNKIESLLRNMIIDFQNSDKWKIQLTIEINFVSPKDVNERRVMHSSSDNIKCTAYKDPNEVVDERVESLWSRYQRNLETPITGSDFSFDSIQLMSCKCHKVDFEGGGSYVDSPDWMKLK